MANKPGKCSACSSLVPLDSKTGKALEHTKIADGKETSCPGSKKLPR